MGNISYLRHPEQGDLFYESNIGSTQRGIDTSIAEILAAGEVVKCPECGVNLESDNCTECGFFGSGEDVGGEDILNIPSKVSPLFSEVQEIQISKMYNLVTGRVELGGIMYSFYAKCDLQGEKLPIKKLQFFKGEKEVFLPISDYNVLKTGIHIKMHEELIWYDKQKVAES